MPAASSIRATIIDVQRDTPRAADSFLIDTQAWYWLSYTRASSNARPYQTQAYPTYMRDAKIAGATLYWSGLSLAELAHLIEKDERDVYNASLSPPGNWGTKAYRHFASGQRLHVVSEITAAWGIVQNFAGPLEHAINAVSTSDALQLLHHAGLDGYDLFLVGAMRDHGIDQILTDDGDYATVPGITVFTANRTVLQDAYNQRKLVTR